MNELTCLCSICVSHRFEVKDRHPEIKWITSRLQKLSILHDLEKTWGKERAKKMFEGGQY